MWVLSCKLKCLSFCFSKPSHSLQPLKLEDTQHNISNQSPVLRVLDGQSAEGKNEEIENTEASDERVEIFLSSSLKKSPLSRPEEIEKGRVKWMDFIGKDLVEIREFVSIDHSEGTGDDEGGNQTCICVIQ